MIKVSVIAMGKLKEKYLRDACEEYQKRLSRYCRLEICEIEPIKIPDTAHRAEIDSTLDKEADLILRKIPKNAFVTALCIEGKSYSSEDFSKLVCAAADSGKHLCFIVGSSYGLSEKIKRAADIRMSVSKMTFPHQLFRVMLLEQIYRAFKISDGSTYHK